MQAPVPASALPLSTRSAQAAVAALDRVDQEVAVDSSNFKKNFSKLICFLYN